MLIPLCLQLEKHSGRALSVKLKSFPIRYRERIEKRNLSRSFTLYSLNASLRKLCQDGQANVN